MSAQEIAAELTDEQAKCLRRMQWGQFKGWPESAHDPQSFNHAGRALMSLGLIQWHPDKRKTLTAMTPLGRQVREILLAKTGGEA